MPAHQLMSVSTAALYLTEHLVVQAGTQPEAGTQAAGRHRVGHCHGQESRVAGTSSERTERRGNSGRPGLRGAHLMRFTIITFRLQVLRQGGVTVCVGVCGHLNCNLRRQSGVSRVALVRGVFVVACSDHV